MTVYSAVFLTILLCALASYGNMSFKTKKFSLLGMRNSLDCSISYP